MQQTRQDMSLKDLNRHLKYHNESEKKGYFKGNYQEWKQNSVQVNVSFYVRKETTEFLFDAILNYPPRNGDCFSIDDNLDNLYEVIAVTRNLARSERGIKETPPKILLKEINQNGSVTLTVSPVSSDNKPPRQRFYQKKYPSKNSSESKPSDCNTQE